MGDFSKCRTSPCLASVPSIEAIERGTVSLTTEPKARTGDGEEMPQTTGKGRRGKTTTKHVEKVKVKKFIERKADFVVGCPICCMFFLNLRCCCSCLGEKKQFKQQSSKKHVWCFFGGVVILKFIDDHYGLS